MSIIAHSFGTYIVFALLRSEFDIRFHKVVFCGSVVSYKFPFEQFGNRYNDQILNEVGTADPWPAVAESVTTGYGSAGTYGFRRPGVRDRFHNQAGHGFFLSSDFCQKFWVPYLVSGRIEKGSERPVPPPYWVRLLSIIKPKYIVGLVLALLCGSYVYEFLTAPKGVGTAVRSERPSTDEPVQSNNGPKPIRTLRDLQLIQNDLTGNFVLDLVY